ncbi:cupin domain-containing protein [Ruegeria sp. WL0004]|uniref:Cupin domain-containing protein n=1 Tax=Ruegeria marisflavi TaxID=2984152 RepID=A0ABT2WVA0_9RHOB|nr:cupin domain-containing protein [Ruegeria sp. WL0004]MCU9838930.1 cupin domain-containing protein [Ruegeria sp. WL0004]
MSSFYQPVTPEGAGETERPAPEKVLSGDPVFTTWNLEERDGLYCGIWRSTPGKWRISYDEWEYCRILSGHSVLTDADGTEITLRAGDSFMLRPGFSGTWEVIETTTKDYVIRL